MFKAVVVDASGGNVSASVRQRGETSLAALGVWIGLAEVARGAQEILQVQVRGRVVVNVNA